ncbi:T6SS phospholipase effector Tle1-like catalytic domain-containing protein [Flavobacterium sp. FlaQc-30]|uniref:T6SS phospholipase effector Tle1-like catalytic domain-containing protein n=1 Tax=Flavobacterium sp. FlaQc-30 TaxID=3374179 RepID=UPI003757DA0C
MSIVFGDYTPPKKELKTNEVIIGVFFDGTNNNKNNTKAKEYYDKRARGEKLTPKETISAEAYRKNGLDKKGSSYYNAWSNVARLSDSYPDKQAVYVDGIGTETEKKDSILGAGLGTAFIFEGTGILDKVEEGCKKIANNLKSNSISKIDVLCLDVFGFSRGAAAARVFLDEISQKAYPLSANRKNKGGALGYYLAQKDIKVDLIKVRFLGLFDTVSSFSTLIDGKPNFDNDTKQLPLNNLGKAKAVMHFTAADEHRNNFSLTTTSVGKTREFPGVHSDVGGSYNDGIEVVKAIEKNFKEKLEKLSEKLVDSAWYLKDQLEISFFGPKHELKGTRNLKNSYSYIPLHFMAEAAIELNVPLKKEKLEIEKYSISSNPLLVRVKKRLHKYVFENAQPYTFKWYGNIHEKYKGVKNGDSRFEAYQQELQEQEDLRTLRNKYLHWSADSDSIGMEPTKDWKRKTF